MNNIVINNYATIPRCFSSLHLFFLYFPVIGYISFLKQTQIRPFNIHVAILRQSLFNDLTLRLIYLLFYSNTI